MSSSKIQQILNSDYELTKKALFQFDSSNTEKEVILKFNLWSRYFFPKYFTSKDAPFHKDIDANNLKIYRGEKKSFINAGFRGCAKTSRTKLFIGFCIANDTDKKRRYYKINSADKDNSVQIVTEIYNILLRISPLYPEIFEKTQEKREERMSSFTTSIPA